MNIYLSNISFRTREEYLQAAFERYGAESSVKIIKDNETHRSKEFGLVEMPNDEQNSQAIAGMNYTTRP